MLPHFLMFESRLVHFFSYPVSKHSHGIFRDYFRYHIEAQVSNMFMHTLASMVLICTSLFGIQTRAQTKIYYDLHTHALIKCLSQVTRNMCAINLRQELTA